MTSTDITNRVPAALAGVPPPRTGLPGQVDETPTTAHTIGPIGRLGRWTTRHVRIVAITWAVIAVGLGVLAPRAEHALSGAGWQASGSESVAARERIDATFGGLSAYAISVVVAGDADLAPVAGRVRQVLEADERIAVVTKPQASRDGRALLVQGGAAASPTEMVKAATELEGRLSALGGDGVTVSVTGAPGMWSDFNEANKSAMLRSELISWPVTLAILVLAFGSLVAAGLPLLLTILGLVASAGTLFVAAQAFDVSIWAMNFALMFALALGIDYALFVVARFRGALRGSKLAVDDAVAVTMDTAGKTVMFSGATVLVSLTAVMLVPSPAFRTTALGIMASVVFVLAATMTLLPAVLGKLGHRVDRLALPWVEASDHRSPRFARWAERLWRRPWAYGIGSLAILVGLALPAIGLQTGMPSIKVVPAEDASRVGYETLQEAFGAGAPGTLQVVTPATTAAVARATLEADPEVVGVVDAGRADGVALLLAQPRTDPSDPAVGSAIERLRHTLPAGALVGGAAAENHDLERALSSRLPLALGVVLGLGFLLLLIALQAPLLAAAGVVTSLLATAAAFGVARLVFQEGLGASLLGFESQGFLNAWGPIFFFAMIFAISMDYTVFLLTSAKEHWDRSHDAREAAIGGLSHSGRTIFAAGGVMVAVFFTFALSGPLPPKEMGVILGVAVLLDAALVRLVLMPVILRVLGARAWALPAWLGRLLPDVRFGH